MSEPRRSDHIQPPDDDHLAQLFATIAEVLRHEPSPDADHPAFFVTPDAWLLLMSLRQTLQFN